MAIQWLTAEAHARLLRTPYPALEIALYEFCVCAVPGPDAIVAAIPTAPRVTSTDLMHDAFTWYGIRAGVPFALLVGQIYDKWGAVIKVAVPVGEHHEVELVALVVDLPAIIGAWALSFYTFPLARPGYGLLESPDYPDYPIYKTHHHADAIAVNDLLVRAGQPGFTIAPIPADPPEWAVYGPRVGNLFSRAESYHSKARARDCVAHWHGTTGAPFVICEPGERLYE